MRPNFLVIGAGRSGTTSLHHYLQQHPQIFIPAVKSPSYFYCRDLEPINDPLHRAITDNYFVPDPAGYERLFRGVTSEKIVGEVSPVYLASVRAALTIAKEMPDAKLIGVLRNPVERIFARYVARTRDGLEERSLERIIQDESREPLRRPEAAGTYLASAFCCPALRVYLENFSPEQIWLGRFEDLTTDTAGFMKEIYRFLDVDSDFGVNTGRSHNSSGGTIRNTLLRKMWTKSSYVRARIRPWIPLFLRDYTFRLIAFNLEKQIMSQDTREILAGLLESEIDELEELTKFDLRAWRI